MRAEAAIGFAEKVLALLDQGAFTSTYKYAVLLGLLDLTLENSGRDGNPPTSFTTEQLTDKVIELYWPHAVPFGQEAGAAVLLQNAGRIGSQAAIVQLIQDFRTRMSERYATGSLVQLRQLALTDFKLLRDSVEWKLIEMPLPRAQTVGNVRERFIYEIGWDERIRQADVREYQRGIAGAFDNRILLKPDVGAHLVQLNALLRPLIHRQWSRMVARLNRLEEARLERFLFGTRRTPLEAVRMPLLGLQQGRCFYCARGLEGASHVDHFIPWSRYPQDGLANLVVAHDRCNLAKSDFLAATDHVLRWAERLRGTDFVALQTELRWDAAVDEMKGVARGIYLRLPADALLWAEGKKFRSPDAADLHTALA